MPPPLVSPFPRPSKKGGERRDANGERRIRVEALATLLLGRGGGETSGWGILKTRTKRCEKTLDTPHAV